MARRPSQDAATQNGLIAALFPRSKTLRVVIGRDSDDPVAVRVKSSGDADQIFQARRQQQLAYRIQMHDPFRVKQDCSARR